MQGAQLSDLSCAILAGGKSSRMGAYKATLKYKGEPLILHVIRGLYDFFDDIVVSVGDHVQRCALAELLHNYEKVKVLVDPVVRVRSPLIGLYTCLMGSRNDYVFATACDMPNVSSKVVTCLREELEGQGYSAIVPMWPNGFVEPLCAIYHRRETLSKIVDALSYSEYSLRGLLKRLRVVKYLPISYLTSKGVSAKVFYNINRLSDIDY